MLSSAAKRGFAQTHQILTEYRHMLSASNVGRQWLDADDGLTAYHLRWWGMGVAYTMESSEALVEYTEGAPGLLTFEESLQLRERHRHTAIYHEDGRLVR